MHRVETCLSRLKDCGILLPTTFTPCFTGMDVMYEVATDESSDFEELKFLSILWQISGPLEIAIFGSKGSYLGNVENFGKFYVWAFEKYLTHVSGTNFDS